MGVSSFLAKHPAFNRESRVRFSVPLLGHGITGSRDLVGQARLISERRWVRFPRLPLPTWIATNGIKVLAAAYVALNHGGEGSSPSDPTEQHNDKCTVRLTERYLRRNEGMRVRFSHGALRAKPDL